MVEKLLRLLLILPRRIYDIFMRFYQKFKAEDGITKTKITLFAILALIIIIPLAAFGFILFLFLSLIGFILSLFYDQRRGPPM